MKETSLEELDDRSKKLFNNARNAICKNPSYAVDVLMNITNRNPFCLEARQVLREAQKKARNENLNGMTRFFSKISNIPFIVGGKERINKDPINIMETAEGLLKNNPQNETAHKLLGQAATALGLNKTAVFAYEELYQLDSESIDSLRSLMRAYSDNGQMDAVIRLGDSICNENGSDFEIQSLIKKASVDKTIKEGNWD